MIRRKITHVVFLAVLLLTSCKSSEKVVRIALALPLTGDIAALGQGIKRAATLALEEANQQNRFPGVQLEVKAFDDRSDPKEAVDIANRIVSDPNIVVVIGHFNSGCSIPASQVYARGHLAMISPAASNPKLTLQQLDPSWKYPKSIFRVNTTDDVQGSFAAEFAANRLHYKKACIIHDKTAYGQGVAEEFRKRFESLGGHALSFDGVTVADKDFNALLTRIKQLKPDLIYWGGDYAGGGPIVRQARGIGEKATLILSEANLDPEFLRVAGNTAEGVYITFLGSPSNLLSTGKSFIEAYKARYPGEEIHPYDAYGYEAMNIALQVIAKVGPDRDKIIAALPTVDYTGVLGETKFDDKGDTLNRTITLFHVKDGKFQPVK
jgi:branched-chain amino acid transport system substrate-binding protein